MSQVETRMAVVIEGLEEENRRFFRNYDGRLWDEEGRGLETKIFFDEDLGETRIVSGYNSLLPKIKGKNVIDVINNKTHSFQEGRRIKILDIGCWTAEALKDCAKEWGHCVDLTGITASLPPWFTRETIRSLSQQNIKVVCGDAHDLAEIFKGGNFDVIFSNCAIGYMFDSARVLEKIWQILGKDGIALINGFYWPKDSFQRDLRVLNKWCRSKGLGVNFQKSEIIYNCESARDFEVVEVTMVKNDPLVQLKLPLVPSGVLKHYQCYPEILTYKVAALAG